MHPALKFAFRYIAKSKLIFFGSVFSMFLGVLCCYIILTWVKTEYSADTFHSNYERIEVVSMKNNAMAKANPSMFYHYDYGDVLGYSGVDGVLGIRVYEEGELKLIKDREEYYGKALVVDSTFFDFFSFQSVSGLKQNFLKNPDEIILTSSFARQVFGTKDAIGETLTMAGGNNGSFIVTGILEDIPTNSSISFDFLVPTHHKDFWSRMGVELLLVNQNFENSSLSEKLTSVVQERSEGAIVELFPFKNIYFDNPFNHSLFPNSGQKGDLIVMTIIGVIILLISLINYINLQITSAQEQTKSRVIKFIHGAGKKELLIDFGLVNLIYLFVTIPACFLFLKLGIPFLQDLLGKEYNISDTFHFFSLLCGGIFFVAIAMIYISFSVLSMKGNVLLELGAIRKGLAKKTVTLAQFICAFVLLFGCVVVFNQFKYMTNKDLGYSYKNIYAVKLIDEFSWDLSKEEWLKERDKQIRNYQLVRSTYDKNPSLTGLTQGEVPLKTSAYPMSWKLLGSGFDYTTHNILTVDPGYKEVFSLEVLEGRFFSNSLDDNRQKKLVINEAAKRYFGLENIETARIANASWGEEDEPFEIIGVVKDFHYEHLSKKVEPLMMMYMQDNEQDFVFRLDSNRLEAGISSLKLLHNSLNPNRVFEMESLEAQVLAQYEKERRLSVLILIFTIVALSIATVGLFTFALIDTQKRVKEIGIRKVLGASFASILKLLTLSYLKWVVLSFLIGTPIAWILMNHWLDSFASRVSLGFAEISFTMVVVLIVAFTSVIGQSFIVAKRNPVDSIRYE